MDDESDVLRGLILQRLSARRTAARLAARLAAARSAPLMPPRKRCERRAGWNPKPRHGSTSPSKQHTQNAWRYDTSKCIWWELLNDADTLNERSFAGDAFYNEFRMPCEVPPALPTHNSPTRCPPVSSAGRSQWTTEGLFSHSPRHTGVHARPLRAASALPYVQSATTSQPLRGQRLTMM